MNLNQAVREFLEDCEVAQGLAARTVANYEHYLTRFLDFAGDITVAAIDDALVRKWRLRLNRTTGLSRTTQNYHLVALRAFLKWLAKRGENTLAPNRIDLPGVREAEVAFLNADVVQKLINAPDLTTRQGKRDRALIETLFSTGLRVAELINLNRKDVAGREEVGVLGKGGKRRVVFFSAAARAAIKTYLAERGDNDPALFVQTRAQQAKRLSTRTVQRLIRQYAAQVGASEHVTPHTLRHTFATDLLQAGADLRAVQALLGHSSVVTTQRYTHLTDTHLKDVHRAFHGRRRQQDS